MNILIAGDSWASGAYTNEKKKNDNNNNSFSFTHTPIQILKPLLEKRNYKVDVEGIPGGSDRAVLRSLKESISKHDYDLVIYYKTCALRSISCEDIKNSGSFKKSIDDFNSEVYEILENLNCRVFLIGGLDKITKNVKVDYVLPSLPEFLLNKKLGDHIDGHLFFDEFKNWSLHNDFITTEDVEYANNIMIESIDAFEMFLKNNDLFPDHAHPGKEATEKFYNLIKDKI